MSLEGESLSIRDQILFFNERTPHVLILKGQKKNNTVASLECVPIYIEHVNVYLNM